jgi:predicted nucleotidyltransferase
MKYVGIICEYNPFHAGHAHLLRQVRDAKAVICLMSGNFTQRGEAAVVPPCVRAEMALAAGADLVLELPFPYSAASARFFASAGVDALQRLGVDMLAFGSESADLPALSAAAERTLEDDFFKKVADGSRNRGDAALFFDALGDALLPNDILAVEYARAVHLRRDQMALLPILRLGSGYHESCVRGDYPSATALRKKMKTGADICDDLPESVRRIWQAGVQKWGVAQTERLGTAMLAALRCVEAKSALTGSENAIADCGGGLLERLIAAAAEAVDYQTLCEAAATKKYTNGRIRRALLYVLSGVTYADLEAPPAYLRLLGANERGRAFLAKTRKTRTVPVVTKQSDVTALGEHAARQQRLAELSNSLYALCLPRPTLPAQLAVIPPKML